MADARSWRQTCLRAFVRIVVTIFVQSLYRVRTQGIGHVPRQGGAVLAANHLSWLDGILLMYLSPRPVRMIVYEGNFQRPWLRQIALAYDAILIGENPKSIARGLQQARNWLAQGEVVGIFPEGGISRSGQLQGFRGGVLKILKGNNAPVIPVYIDGMWGSIFSFQGGRFFWKWPRCWPYPVTLHFGPPIAEPNSAFALRQAVQDLGSRAMTARTSTSKNLLQLALRALKRRAFRPAMADSLGTQLTGGLALLRALILRRLLLRQGLSRQQKRVGVLLPPSVAGVVTNLALSLDRRIVVNLNYSLSQDSLRHCVEVAELTHVVTSHTFWKRFQYDLPVQWIFLEDLRKLPTWWDKASGFLQAYLCPAWILEPWLGITQIAATDEMTTIFTSGSTGMPKGVVLTYGNIGTNVQAIDDVINLQASDVLVGILPFFHAFGYTVTLWSVLGLDIKGIYHFNPLEAQQIGKLAREHGATILVSTPTFLRPMIQRCDTQDFQHLSIVVTGAEKLPPTLADKFEEKFHIRPVEGYGTTELSPLVSVNIPPTRQQVDFQTLARAGSVGRPVPGVAAKVTDLDTGISKHAGESGMLWISGPNVMAGYLHDPVATSKVLVDGWYKTGDLAYIDSDGFLFITGRESRFSKIGGEMVPHGVIEEALQKIVGENPDAPPRVAVTAVPDTRKGERLVVLHTPMEQTPSQICAALRNAGLANLWVPSPSDFVEVDAIPLLGTGKADLKAMRTLAAAARKGHEDE